jgi:hypothetical protein
LTEPPEFSGRTLELAGRSAALHLANTRIPTAQVGVTERAKPGAAAIASCHPLGGKHKAESGHLGLASTSLLCR